MSAWWLEDAAMFGALVQACVHVFINIFIIMYRNLEEGKLEKIEKKIKDTELEKNRAITKRVQELEKEKKMDKGPSQNIQTLKREL